ncbi:MAG: flavin reductase [Gammaproteobacteria bacterium]|nr:flavin reductase [Gammaproteobacteria bacterium]
MSELTPELFRKASGYWATGVSIVTTCDLDQTPYGLTMNSVTSVSLTPPLFLICVDNKSDTLEPMRRSGVFCINVLSLGQHALSNGFAKKNPNKFEGVEFDRGVTGAPRLHGRLMAIECAVTASHAGGDHQIFIGEVRAITLPEVEGAEPLLYFRGGYAQVLS